MTIEEKADIYRDEVYKKDIILTPRGVFLDGARAQKQIDIARACEWLKVATQCGVHPCSSNSFVKDFRKAMEESL